jgi:hypothetical protein
MFKVCTKCKERLLATTDNLVGFKNYIINGDKRVNQRGYSDGVLANGVYGYDRWKGADSDANIEQLLRAAMQAPSAKNEQRHEI